jgi:AraC family transcriptional regulator, regulatory protein of adaptative response / methylated-DNA-[protein]-cysteine methyltransferase
VHLSEYHFQRLFTRWVGISPKRFLQFITKENARRLLEEAGSILDAASESGLSSTGRLHDLFLSCEAMTPGQYKNRGRGLKIQYGFHLTPFGECLIALTGSGICSLSFVNQGNRDLALQNLLARWQNAELQEDPVPAHSLVAQIFNLEKATSIPSIPIYLTGTNFQIKVWEALIRIPAGQVVSYQNLAAYLGFPSASRAVGQAVAANPVMFLIPCHRVIRSLGEFGSYQGGSARKKAMIGWEMARTSQSELGHPQEGYLV